MARGNSLFDSNGKSGAFFAATIAHGLLFTALGSADPPPPPAPVAEAMAVSLFDGAGLALEPAPATLPAAALIAVPAPVEPPPPEPPTTQPIEPPGPDSVLDFARRLIAKSPASLNIAPDKPSAAPPPVAVPATASAGRDCALEGPIQAALQASEPVRAALGKVPPTSRSVANAIMLWDGAWVDPAKLGGATAIDPIRDAIIAGIAAAPADCRGSLLRGPRLLAIVGGQDTTLIALGSGEWRWSDLQSSNTRAPAR